MRKKTEPDETGRISMMLKPQVESLIRQANSRKVNGDYSIALALYDKALEMEPENSRAWHSKGNVYDMMGKFNDAVNCYNKAIECDPHNAETWYNKGVTLKKTGCDEEGSSCIQHGISLALGR